MLVVLDELSTAVLLCVLVETVLDDTTALELLSTLDTIEEDVLVVVLVVVEVDDTTLWLSLWLPLELTLETPVSLISLVSLDLHPESKIAAIPTNIKKLNFFINFVLFSL